MSSVDFIGLVFGCKGHEASGIGNISRHVYAFLPRLWCLACVYPRGSRAGGGVTCNAQNVPHLRQITYRSFPQHDLGLPEQIYTYIFVICVTELGCRVGTVHYFSWVRSVRDTYPANTTSCSGRVGSTRSVDDLSADHELYICPTGLFR